jgi:hypothetical protein
MEHFATPGPLVFFLPFFGILYLGIIVSMVFDAAYNNGISRQARIVWIISIVIFPFIGGMLYAFTARRKKVSSD